MICPYTVAKTKTVNRYSSQQGDGPDESNTQTIEVTERTMMECPKEECGAYDWDEGRCSYKGAVN